MNSERLPIAWAEECPPLIDPASFVILARAADNTDAHLRQAFNSRLALIVIDTMAAGAGFSDENSAAKTSVP